MRDRCVFWGPPPGPDCHVLGLSRVTWERDPTVTPVEDLCVLGIPGLGNGVQATPWPSCMHGRAGPHRDTGGAIYLMPGAGQAPCGAPPSLPPHIAPTDPSSVMPPGGLEGSALLPAAAAGGCHLCWAQDTLEITVSLLEGRGWAHRAGEGEGQVLPASLTSKLTRPGLPSARKGCKPGGGGPRRMSVNSAQPCTVRWWSVVLEGSCARAEQVSPGKWGENPSHRPRP